MSDLRVARSEIIDVVDAMKRAAPGRHDDWISKLVHAKTLVEGVDLRGETASDDDSTGARDEIRALRAARADILVSEQEARAEIRRLRSSEMNFMRDHGIREIEIARIQSALTEAQSARAACEERLRVVQETVLAEASAEANAAAARKQWIQEGRRARRERTERRRELEGMRAQDFDRADAERSATAAEVAEAIEAMEKFKEGQEQVDERVQRAEEERRKKEEETRRREIESDKTRRRQHQTRNAWDEYWAANPPTLRSEKERK